MKNLKNFTPEKYAGCDYEKIEDGIYKTHLSDYDEEDIYVTSLAFEFEPERYGE